MLEATAHHSAFPDRDLHYSSFALRSLTPHIGAEITGIDLSKPLEPQQEADVRRALRDWMVLVFRDQELYADMYLAYELLSEPVQRMLEGLAAVHDGALPYVGAYKTKPPEGGYPRSRHPVVTRHPETRRMVLYVNSGFTTHIVGLSRRESNAILDMLFRHIDSTPRLYCRVEWRPHTLTFWDNRCTQHHMASYARASGRMDPAAIDALLADLRAAIESATYLLGLPQFLVTGRA